MDAKDPRDGLAAAADAYAVAPLLNCLLREVGERVEPDVYRLRAGGRLLRVRGGRRSADPELHAGGAWHRLTHAELVKLTAEELHRHTGLSNPELPAEMLDSRGVVAALLAARARATAPADPYVRSEQSLVTGHPHHPAPKARGGGPAAAWLPYAPEAYASFPLILLGVREDVVVEEGDTTALDTYARDRAAPGCGAPPGYRPLPAHPWQLALVAEELVPAFADGRLVRLGSTTAPVSPTAAIRTVYAPDDDLFLKFSLDVRITNDVRRLWRHDLLKLRRADAAVTTAFAGLPGAGLPGAGLPGAGLPGAGLPGAGPSCAGPSCAEPRGAGLPSAWLSDRGYRTADFAFEELAVLVRDGLRPHLAPGTTPLLAAALTEDFDGNPLDRTTDPNAWWEAYLRAVVPPALGAFHGHGVVLEAHLQNTVVAVGPDGLPVQALFRDAEGVKLVPDVTRAAGWERLVYCLVVNNLLEIGEAVAERHPGADLWPAARRELARHREIPEIAGLLASPTLPGKTNLLLRWTGADGADARYLPLPNPLRGA